MANPFKPKANNKAGGGAQVPPGMHPGVLVALIDLGTHWDSFKGQAERKIRRLYLIWELEVERGGKDERVWIGKDYTLGLDKEGGPQLGLKSSLRKLLEGWRGKTYGDQEDIDLTALPGKGCLVNVAEEARGQQSYSVISSVSPLAKGMKGLKPSHPPLTYQADGGKDEPAPDADWIPYLFGRPVSEHLEECLEWGGDGRRKGKNGQPVGAAAGNGGDEEEVPF